MHQIVWTQTKSTAASFNEIFYKEIDIHDYTQDTEHKLHKHFHRAGHCVFALPKLWDLPLPQPTTSVQEKFFWLGQNVELGEALE